MRAMETRLPSGYFYGESLRSRNLAGFTLAETLYGSGQRLDRHSHEQSCFIIVLEGSFTESYGRRTRACSTSSVIFRPSDEVHADHFERAGGRCFNVQLELTWLSTVRERARVLEDSADFQGGAIFWLAMKLYREFRHADEVSPLVIEGLALEMLAEATRLNTHRASDTRAPRWLTEAMEIIRERFNEKLTVAEVASLVGVHPVYLAGVFRKFYHSTIGEYARRLRVEFACREIAASGASLSHIAAAAGFYDQSHFSKTFKSFTGMTPAEFRATHQRN
jgi:AraC family transcriptional regulator